jgi:predicted amino acid dehydrogenase
MERFAFVLHPLSLEDMQMVSPMVRYVPDFLLEYILKQKKPFTVSHITGVKSPHAEAEGWFVGCPLTAKQMVELPEEFVIDRIVETGKIAEELGAKILGLGAFTSIVGDAGVTIAERLNIAVTSGNSYTVATALEGTREAARLMGKDLRDAEVAIVGASGSIGSACARILSREVRHINLIARRIAPLEELAQELNGHGAATFSVSSDVKSCLHKADVVIAVTSAVDFIIDPADLKSGAVVCDVARPRNVSRNVSAQRNDVLVIEGGVIHVPGNVDFHFNFGFPPQTCFACMAETMILALEGRYENFTLGRNLILSQIDTISGLAKKHGFTLAGFRNFEHAVTKEMIESIREHVKL